MSADDSRRPALITERPPVPARRRLVLAVMCVGYFLVLLDVTVVNVALPGIGVGLGAGVSGLQWVVDGYALPLAALLLAGGTIGDVRGHKRVVMTGMALFGTASAACALAPSTGGLVAARVVQGVGAALLLPGTLAIISNAFPEPSEQARAIGAWAGIGSVALPAGPLVGGLLVQGPGWRWVFLVNVPVVLVAGLVAARIVPADRVRDEGRRIDWAGTALGAGTLAAATFAVIESGRAGLSPTTLAATAVAAGGLVAFLVTERVSHDPMLPLGLFRSPAFSAANGLAGLMNLGTLGLLFVLTLYLQQVQGRSAVEAGTAVLPLFLPLVVLSPLGGAVVSRIGPRVPAVAGLLVTATGTALATGWQPDTSYLRLLPALVCWGSGLGLLTPALVAAAIGSAPPGRSGTASGINNTARQAGGAVGIALYGAVAGTPTATAGFVRGLHLLAVGTAGAFAAGAVTAAALLAGRRGRPERRP